MWPKTYWPNIYWTGTYWPPIAPAPGQLLPSIVDTMVFQDVFIDQLFIEPTTIDEVDLP